MADVIPTPKATRRDWIGLGVLSIACLLYSMDLTVLNIAIPHLTADLKPTAAQLLWIVDIYGFLVAGSLVTMGTLGDRIGRRKVLLVGAAAFGAISVFAAFATTPNMLILARGLMGISAAALAPSTLSLIRNMFLDDRERTIAIGLWIASFSAGGAIGPLVGGLLLEHFWWGSVLLLNAPVMLVLLMLGPVLLPEFKDPNAGRLDILSAAMSVVAVLSVIWGLKHVAVYGPGVLAFTALVVGLFVGALFVRRQLRLPEPLIDLSLFRIPAIGASLTVNILGLFAIFGIFLVITQYFQLVLGMGPLEAGIWMAPSGVAFALGSLITPWLTARFRPCQIIAGGFLSAALGFVLMAGVGTGQGWFMLAGLIAMSVGFSPIATITTDLVMASVEPERAGAASAISETSFEFGGALGIAVLGSLFSAAYRTLMDGIQIPGVGAEQLAYAQDTLGGALSVAAEAPSASTAQLADLARDAFVQSLVMTSAICAVIALATALFALRALRGPHDRSPADRPVHA
ncbi:MFS transporter [Flaviflagellibacter deserti]|uniref:MFS transporter n=1 Tax=Flaviflagellibacter deserti TaxID=2267266 RepID=A0ABV9Z1W2_9HYPH